ncbi:hypothetical protein BDB01DRAFT_847675 [Pilobolus umbonatus]|nr:hypothetical protein BDB01DRAFT_847675 [Pilobolus umbonatus]
MKEDPIEMILSPSSPKKNVLVSRRAEQNRAAQRAFRQRKERYVKELEAKVNSMADWPSKMERLEKENEQLKRRLFQIEGQHELEEDSKKQKNTYTNTNYYSDIHTSYDTSPPLQPTSFIHINHTNTTLDNTMNDPPIRVGEKGRVLDDLVSLLRTRHRPPIPSHPPN